MAAWTRSLVNAFLPMADSVSNFIMIISCGTHQQHSLAVGVQNAERVRAAVEGSFVFGSNE
jgi:hypothetical protein